jgi:hypothetical protein
MKEAIVRVCDEIKNLLLDKNKAYGNSALDPVRIFSKVDAVEQINVRIDDKLSRIARGTEYPGDDTELDLIGYLILKRVIKMETLGGYMITDYKKLVGQLQAITPMCNFEMPETLCTKMELCFRRHYTWMDKEITVLINLIPSTHASKAT